MYMHTHYHPITHLTLIIRTHNYALIYSPSKLSVGSGDGVGADPAGSDGWNKEIQNPT